METKKCALQYRIKLLLGAEYPGPIKVHPFSIIVGVHKTQDVKGYLVPKAP